MSQTSETDQMNFASGRQMPGRTRECLRQIGQGFYSHIVRGEDWAPASIVRFDRPLRSSDPRWTGRSVTIKTPWIILKQPIGLFHGRDDHILS